MEDITCCPVETVEVTENRSTMMTSMNDQFGMERSDSFDVYIMTYFCSDMLSQSCRNAVR